MIYKENKIFRKMFKVTEYAALRVRTKKNVSQPKHMLWVLKRTVSHSQNNVKTNGYM